MWLLQVKVEKCNAIVNALNRTKVEESPDLASLQEERAAEIRREQKNIRKKQEQVNRANNNNYMFALLLSRSV
jgi:hypothetical protein